MKRLNISKFLNELLAHNEYELGPSYKYPTRPCWRVKSELINNADLIHEDDWLQIFFIFDIEKFSDNFLQRFSRAIYWDAIALEIQMSESFIKKHKDKMSSRLLAFNQKFISDEYRRELKSHN